jgi:hypothetical protein
VDGGVTIGVEVHRTPMKMIWRGILSKNRTKGKSKEAEGTRQGNWRQEGGPIESSGRVCGGIAQERRQDTSSNNEGQ